jgi:Uma2 family endonuclease
MVWGKCPDVVFGLTSTSDKVPALCEKMRAYLRNGAKLGVLILVHLRCVEFYRSAGDVVMCDSAAVELTPELPDFRLELSEIFA